MPRLVHFVNESEDREFVVIFDEDEPDTSEFEEGGNAVRQSVEIVGNTQTFPTSRALVDEARG